MRKQKRKGISLEARKSRNGSKWAGKFLTVVCLVIICLYAGICFWWGDGSGGISLGKRNQHQVEVPDWITKQYLSISEYSRSGRALNQVNGIVVHYVANPGSTGWDNWHYFENLKEDQDTKASSHFIIGLDGTIIQCIPLDEMSYCSNNRNGDTISIECCHPDETGEFTQETYQSLVKLCKWLVKEYDLEAEDVIRHYDVTGKLCPLYYVEHEDAWEEFQKKLK